MGMFMFMFIQVSPLTTTATFQQVEALCEPGWYERVWFTGGVGYFSKTAVSSCFRGTGTHCNDPPTFLGFLLCGSRPSCFGRGV